MKYSTAIRPTRFRAGQRINTEAIVKRAIWPQALYHDHTALLARLGLHMHSHRAALIADGDTVAFSDVECCTIVRMH